MSEADACAAGPARSAWKTFCLAFVLTVGASLAAFAAAVVVLDPYDTGHFLRSGVRGTAEKTPRFAHASRGRDPRFNAAIFGNSHVQLLSPARLKERTGLEFVSLTVPGSGVKEKIAMLGWFVRSRPVAPAALVIGIDEFDCATGDALLQPNPFPFWVYAPSPVAHVLGAFHVKGVSSLAGAVVGVLRSRMVSDDGYWDYEAGRTWTAPELPRVRSGALGPALGPAAQPGPLLGVTLLADAVRRLAPGTQVIFVRPPVHISALPAAGSAAAAHDRACDEAVMAFAATRPGTSLLDFRTADPALSGPELYWDSTHYRRPVAERIEADIAARVTHGPLKASANN